MKKKLILHPVLFGLFPILFLLNHNKEQIGVEHIRLPVIVVLCVICVLFFIFKLISRDSQKSALIVSCYLFLFYFYGYFYDLLPDFTLDIKGFLIGRNKIFFPLWCSLFYFFPYIILKIKKDLWKLTKILNVVAVFLIINPLIGLVDYHIRTAAILDGNRSKEEIKENIAGADDERSDLPDIYYIILDGYANAHTLKDIYKYDNSEFIDYLTKKGFYVASQSTTNYPSSFLSLASSLNMKYLNYLSKSVGLESDDRAVPNEMIIDSMVVRKLKAKGYKSISFSSGWWGPTDRNPHADMDYWWGFGVNEFVMILSKTTMMKPFARFFEGERIDRLLATFSKLGDLKDIKGPKYVFAHIMCPHSPFVFDRNGNSAKNIVFTFKGDVWLNKDEYIDQLVYTNKRMKGIIENILNDSKIPPIIIIQGDHGTASTLGRMGRDGWWTNLTDGMYKERMRIFNAYLVPDKVKKNLYKKITPVNSFRLIFSQYFNEDYDLLEDRNYFSSYEHPYEFLDVTDIVEFKDNE